MPYTSSPIDGVQIYYRDYIPATSPKPFRPHDTAFTRPALLSLVFIHGWPMNSLMYDHLMLPLCETWRIRCVAIDRRGFGKTEWRGTNPVGDVGYDTFADDTVSVLEQLKLGSFVFVAASMGCGETVLAWERSDFVRKYCKGFIWIGPTLPHPIQTPDNPTAPSRDLWDNIVTSLRTSRAAFVQASLPNLFGAHVGAEVDSATLARFERIVDQADALAIERCVQMLGHDFTDQLTALKTESVLILQGDSDKSLPYEAGAKLIEALIPSARVSMYEKAGHGLYLTHAAKVMDDILAFVKSPEAHTNPEAVFADRTRT